MKFLSRLLKSATANSVIKEGLARYGKNPNYPQDQIGIDKLYEHLDMLVRKQLRPMEVLGSRCISGF